MREPIRPDRAGCRGVRARGVGAPQSKGYSRGTPGQGKMRVAGSRIRPMHAYSLLSLAKGSRNAKLNQGRGEVNGGLRLLISFVTGWVDSSMS